MLLSDVQNDLELENYKKMTDNSKYPMRFRTRNLHEDDYNQASQKRPRIRKQEDLPSCNGEHDLESESCKTITIIKQCPTPLKIRKLHVDDWHKAMSNAIENAKTT